MEVIVDWFAATFLKVPIEPVQSFFNRFVESWEEGRGHYGYASGARSCGICIYSAGAATMGFMVQLSGEGCGWVASHSQFRDWCWFRSELASRGGRENRTDLAFDVGGGVPAVSDVRRALEEGLFVSEWNQWDDRRSMSRGGVRGDALYLGSASSDCCLVVYDKRLERLAHGIEIGEERTRFELRYKHALAVAFWDAAVREGGIEIAQGLLAGRVRFLSDRTRDHNDSHKLASWWQVLMGGVCVAKLQKYERAVNYEREVTEFKKQHGTKLYMLEAAAEASGRDLMLVRGIIDEGGRKVTGRHLSRLQALIRSAKGEVIDNILADDGASGGG